MKLSNEIKMLLLSFLNDDIIVSSWGIYNITISSSSLKFKVNGLKYQGFVNIEYQDKYYLVVIGGRTFKVCTPEEVLKKMDDEIEQTKNYICDLSKLVKD